MAKEKKKSEEFGRFEKFAKALASVPKSEIDKRAAVKSRKKRRTKRQKS